MQKTVALVTGGAQGIGKAIVKRLAAGGAQICFVDIDAEAGKETQRELNSGGTILFVHGDASQEATARTAARKTILQFGQLDLLVNNVGTWTHKSLEQMTVADWNRVLGVNLTSVFLFSKQCAPHLKKQSGAIVNIASTRALMSEAGTEAYSASKGGIVALTHSLAVSLGPAVRVNCISPGWIDVGLWKKSSKRKASRLSRADHAQHPAGRVGKPEDIAELVNFLSSPAAGFVTGANIVIDGGMTRKMIYVE